MPTTWRTWRVPSAVSCVFCAEMNGAVSSASRTNDMMRVIGGMVGDFRELANICNYTLGTVIREKLSRQRLEMRSVVVMRTTSRANNCSLRALVRPRLLFLSGKFVGNLFAARQFFDLEL